MAKDNHAFQEGQLVTVRGKYKEEIEIYQVVSINKRTGVMSLRKVDASSVLYRSMNNTKGKDE